MLKIFLPTIYMSNLLYGVNRIIYMKKFIIILKDKQNGTLTSELLKQHVSHLRNLTALNKLYLCGPFKDDNGALQIIMANKIEDAEELVNKDPFIREKYYNSYSIYELIEANEDNNWLCEDTQTKINLREFK